MVALAERTPNGPRLFAVAADGSRCFALLAPHFASSRDSNVAISPDGKWLVFASSRGLSLSESNLWLAQVGLETSAWRLTEGAWIDTHPTWTPDGQAVVFASTRSGSFDLWRQEIEVVRGHDVANGKGFARVQGGAVTQLTQQADTHEVTPFVAADGRVLFTVVATEAPLTAPSAARPIGMPRIGDGPPLTDAPATSSYIAQLGPGGRPVRISLGQDDGNPQLSPDGTTLAFTAPVTEVIAAQNGERAAFLSAELFVRRGQAGPQRLVTLPETDESGPVWAPDGKAVLATSVLRGADGRVLFSAVIVVLMDERGQADPEVRMLTANAPVERLHPAWLTQRYDRASLARLPLYRATLRQIVSRAVAQHGLADGDTPAVPK